MDHLIMADGQDEIFRILVDHREGQQIVLVLAIDRVEGKITQRVIHPAHVPFESEAETTLVDSSAIIIVPGCRS